MNAEKISIDDDKSPLNFSNPKETNKTIPGRVNINELLDRVRNEKKRQNKINLIFLGFFASFIFVVGIILSF